MGCKLNRIFAHRGLWLSTGLEKNSIEAFTRALEAGFSLELDLRDHNGEIIVSHDPVSSKDTILKYSDFLSLAQAFPESLLGLNIKSDGLAPLLSRKPPVNSHFFFDMSIPETLQYRKQGLPVATRASEYEPLNDKSAKYFWIDSFVKDLRSDEIRDLIGHPSAPSLMVFVSPELHGRDKSEFWERFVSLYRENDFIGICTDYPDEFSELVRRRSA
jgi:glycerophosphoryl diester phosphodiesterase